MENHSNINNQFIPYNLALELKELGFDEECFGWWSWINENTASFYSYPMSNKKMDEHNMNPKNCSAPLWQQAFEWFREKYDCEAIYNIIPPEAYKNNDKIKKYSWYVWNLHSDPRIQPNHRGFVDTYEEARLVCLEKLIEIAKKQK